jgi:glycosyltransferase involved in cell wall biosynthesis
MKPFFSIIIPLYNKERQIKDTLNSVFNQTFKNFEVIIVNDGSTDASLEKVSSFVDLKIKKYSIENQGVSYARNYGIENSKGEHIVFLDADDQWFAHHLLDLKQLIEQYPDCGLYAKGYECIYYNKSTFKAKFLDIAENHYGIVEDYFHSSQINAIAWTSALAIPRIILDKYGLFDISLKSGQDTDLWVRIALNENVAFDPKISSKKIMTSTGNHLSQTSHVYDRINILNKFTNQEINHKSFKKYMDLNRFSIAIERKIAGDMNSFYKILKDIQLVNLTQKQIFLLKSPRFILYFLKALQTFLIKNNIYLSPYR